MTRNISSETPQLSKLREGQILSELAGLIQVTARALPMPTPEDTTARRERHCVEIEANQADLRKSIKATELLVTQSDEILRRHRKECEAGEAASDK